MTAVRPDGWPCEHTNIPTPSPERAVFKDGTFLIVEQGVVWADGAAWVDEMRRVGLLKDPLP